MKLFIVIEIGYEYNDEYYRQARGGHGSPVKAFRVREHAQEECDKLNREKARNSGMRDGDDRPIAEFYRIAEVEVADEQVEDYATARARAKEAQKQARAATRGAFLQGAAVLFARFPGLESFGWRQYTPYFNDGDACTFGVHCDEPEINGESSGDFDPGYKYVRAPGGRAGNGYQRVETGARDPRLDWAEAVTQLVSSFAEDDLEHLFGDHVEVTVHRDGRTETEECSHD